MTKVKTPPVVDNSLVGHRVRCEKWPDGVWAKIVRVVPWDGRGTMVELNIGLKWMLDYLLIG